MMMGAHRAFLYKKMGVANPLILDNFLRSLYIYERVAKTTFIKSLALLFRKILKGEN